MKILQVGKFYAPSLGGIETVVRTLSEGLVEKGTDVTVLCFSTQVKQITEDHLSGVRVLRVPTPLTLFSQPLSRHFIPTLLKEAEKHDVLHFHVPNPLAELGSLFLPEAPRYVATFHAEVQRQKLLKPFYRPLVRHFLRKSQGIIAATKTQLETSPSVEGFSEKFRVIPFSLPHLKLTELAERAIVEKEQELTRKYGAYFLFVGRLVSYKGLPYLIQAMGQIQTQMPLNLVIVGEGPEQEALKLEVSRLGLEKRVYFEGRVQDDQDLVSYYRRCEFLVLPSITHAEAFGVVLLEAMRQGKPLITTQLKSGVSEVNPDGVTGFQVRPADSNELARAILRLTTNKQLCAELGEAAKKRFDNQYSLPKMVEAHLSLYQSVLTGS